MIVFRSIFEKTMKKKNVLNLLISFFLLFGLSLPVFAQSSTGSLSFNPSSFNATNTTATSVDIVYTGTEISGAELHIVVGSDLSIESLTPGPGLFEILSIPANGEIHVGKLPDPITSGSVLATVTLKAINCNSSGTITFNQTETMIPDVTISYSNASYTTNCTSGGGITPPPSGITPKGQLPKTDIDEGTFWNLVYASIFVSIGAGIFYLYKSGVLNPKNINE